MADIFREVDEELRQERMEKLWQKHGKSFVTGCLVIVILTAGYVLFRDWRAGEAARVTGDLAAAVGKIEGAKDDDARALAVKSLAAFAEKAPEGPATLARLQLAADQAKADDTKAAIANWQAIADDAKADSLLRDLARLRLATAMIDSADPKILRAQLEPLAAEKAPFRGSAGIMLALVDLRDHQQSAAKTRLDALANDIDLPGGLRDRAQRLAQTIVIEDKPAADKPAEPATPAPAPAETAKTDTDHKDQTP